MATIQKGILGRFSGKVGTVVGANWRGQDVIRSVPKKSTRIPIELQQEQRLKFRLASKFLAPIAPLTRNWFGQPAGVKSPPAGASVPLVSKLKATNNNKKLY